MSQRILGLEPGGVYVNSNNAREHMPFILEMLITQARKEGDQAGWERCEQYFKEVNGRQHAILKRIIDVWYDGERLNKYMTVLQLYLRGETLSENDSKLLFGEHLNEDRSLV